MAAVAARALDIVDLLATRKVEVEQAYESQKSNRGQVEQQVIAATQEMFRLEGEHRCLESLAKAVEESK
jgi:hypothetical protein